MRTSIPLLMVAVAAITASTVTAPAQIVINEVDVDQAGDDAGEFVELFDGGVGNTSLDGLALVFYNGSNDLSYLAIDLAGEQTDAQGYYVIGNAGVPGVDKVFPGNTLQNGADAVVLYVLQPGQTAATQFPNNTSLIVEDLVDALVYGTSDPDDLGLLTLLFAGEPQVDENLAGTGTSVSMARLPNGGDGLRTSNYGVDEPTPGGSNSPSESLTLEFAVTTISEAAAPNGTTGTITRSGATTSAVTVTLTNGDSSEIVIPPTVTIPAGAPSANFAVGAVDDAWLDGSRSVNVSVTALGYQGSSATLTVTDDGDAAGLLINEFHATGLGDANVDGTNTNRGFDEFIELVNVGTAPMDVSGFTVLDGAGLAGAAQARHTFPAGTVIDPNSALVLFGGGDVPEGISGNFGTAWVQKCNGDAPFGLGLNDRGDIITVRNTTGAEVAGAVYGALSAEDDESSQNLQTELTGSAQFVPHHSVAGSAGALMSPGTRASGAAFRVLTVPLAVQLLPGTIVENAGAGAAIMRVTRPAPLTGDLTVLVTSEDTTEATPAQSPGVIANGQASVDIPIDAVNDTASDGTQSVTLRATAAGFLDGTGTLTVQDDGSDVPLEAIFINEVDSDQPMVDSNEFIEIYDGGLGNRSLDGFIVVLFNGATDTSYLTIDLSGQSTNGGGFLVIGNSGVAGAGLTFPNDTLQNGVDAVAIYRTSADTFPNGTPVTTTDLVDAIVYGRDGAGDDSGLLDILTPGKPQANDGLANNTTALARRPDATTAFDPAAFVLQVPTPGSTNVISTSGYDGWAAAFPGLGARTDDPDVDGLVNILEYALGGDPLEPDSSVLPQVSTGAEGKPRLTVAKGSAASGDPGLTYTIEASTTLVDGSWSTTDVAEVTNTSTTLAADYSGPSGTAFLRLSVNLAP